MCSNNQRPKEGLNKEYMLPQIPMCGLRLPLRVARLIHVWTGHVKTNRRQTGSSNRVEGHLLFEVASQRLTTHPRTHNVVLTVVLGYTHHTLKQSQTALSLSRYCFPHSRFPTLQVSHTRSFPHSKFPTLEALARTLSIVLPLCTTHHDDPCTYTA